MAIICTASTIAGKMRCRIRSIRSKPDEPGVVMPATGSNGLAKWNHRTRYTPKNIWSITANQKLGMESPTNAPVVETVSNQEYWCRAEYTPIPPPMIRELQTPNSPRMIEFTRACRISTHTDFWLISDVPQSPRTKWASHDVYC